MQNRQTKLVVVNKDKADEMTFKLSKRIILDNHKFDYVLGIENGGLNVSIPLSKMLELPHKSIKISFYNDENKINKIPNVDFHGININKSDKVLVVDDLIDSSATFNYFKNNIICNYKIAVLYWNKYNKNKIIPDYYIEEKFMNTWLEFYWEKK